MEDVLEGIVTEADKGIVRLLSGEVDNTKDETTYAGLKLIDDKEYKGGTSIKYWM